MRYKLISEEFGEFCRDNWRENFEGKVSEYLRRGYIPLGRPFQTGDFINQAVWKPVKDAATKKGEWI